MIHAYVFAALADEFSATEENRFRFLVRGGPAFGPSIHAADIPLAACGAIPEARGYRDSILLGMPNGGASDSA